jgi:hypothetical protein
MRTRSSPRIVASVVATATIGMLAGCGGGSQIEMTAAPQPRFGTLRIGPPGAAQFRARGADNSLEEYGHEARRAEVRQAASDVHGYLMAWVKGNWPQACALGSSKLHKILRGVTELSGRGAPVPCAKAIAAVARGETPLAATKYEATEVDARSLRVEGDYGYLLFYSDGHEPRQQEMFRKDGSWKVKAPLPSSLE